MRFPSRLVLPAILLTAICCVPPAAHAQVDEFHTRFNSVLTQHGIVGGGVAIVHAQDPAMQFFFGEARQGMHQRIDADTAYNWASITKTMTAIAILQLRDRKKLSLDDPAVRYVPELRQVHDEYGPIDDLTIRQLLSHSAGFRNPTWPWDCDDPKNCDWQPFEPTDWAQVAAMLPFTHIAFKPGSRWSYSNLGYVFLGQIIKRLSGDDFEVYIDKNILKPLDMSSSYFDRAPYFLEQHVSASYIRAGDKLTPQPFNFDTGITTSNSGLKAPIPDMVKYLRFLIGDPANPLYPVVLKRSSLEEAWTGVIPVADPGQPPTPYTKDAPMMGLGFFVMQINGHRYIYHDGDQGGFSAEMLIDPARHIASILTVNTTDTGAPLPVSALRPESNTEPDPGTDLRLTLRRDLVDKVFPANFASGVASEK
ncbi:MAG TPA: serine hydrolase domain-containing protein [Terracidiphilus sp.]|jgi:CubicO group peptidase (beta-lactamase class C family)|nr:serine hydrolase domain-containing protein [Terracidiphilus sp.]